MGLQTGRGDGAENTKWKFVFYARPHPDLLPRGEEIAGARFWFCGGAAVQSSRGVSKTAADVSPSGEQAGMREVVKSNCAGLGTRSRKATPEISRLRSGW